MIPTAYAASKCTWILCGLTALLAASTLASARAETSAPDTTSANVGGQSLRGTEAALQRRSTVFQQTGRAILFVPYAAFEVFTWPLGRFMYLNDRYGILPKVADFLAFRYKLGPVWLESYFVSGGGAGSPAPGLKAHVDDWSGSGSKLEMTAGYLSSDRNQVVLEASTVPGPLQFDIFAEFHKREDQSFYGIGSTSPDEKFAANRQRLLIESSLRFEPHDRIQTSIAGYFRDTRLSSPSAEDPVANAFPALFARAEASQYVGVEGAIAYDQRDRGPFSSSGFMMRATGGFDAAQDDDDEDYTHYSGELQAFINLYKHTRVLALRAYGAGVDADDPAALPYTELQRPGGRDGFRGYNSYRFADRTQLLLTAEYHYPVSSRVQGGLFVDWGSVAPEWGHMRLADIEPSYGFSLRVGKQRPLSLQIAFSDEDLLFFFGVESVFRSSSRRQQ